MRAPRVVDATSIVEEAMRVLRLYAGKFPENLQGGCAHCGSDGGREHKPGCKYKRARRVLSDYAALRRTKAGAR